MLEPLPDGPLAGRALHTEASPFVDEPQLDKFLYWCEPVLVVQVNYGEFTEQRHRRFPIFSSLRPDVSARDCTMDVLSAE